MRRRLPAGSSIATFLMLTSCSGSPAPTRPSASLPVTAARTADPAPAAPLVMPWSCLTQRAVGTRGVFAAGNTAVACPAPLRLSASAAASAAPSAPANVTSSVNGSTVTVSWHANGNAAATSYLIEASLFASFSTLVAELEISTTSFTATDVPPGTYYVRVKARNSAGTSDATSGGALIVGGGPCAGAPNATSSLVSSVSGSSLSLSWTAPASGCAPTGYVIEAGSTPGASNLANFNTGSTGTTFSTTGVPAGTYYVRVRAANGFSAGGPTNEVTVVVGGTTFTPTPTPTPTAIRWVGQAPDGMIVTLDPQDQCPAEYDLQLDLTASGTVVTGTAIMRTRRVEAGGDCSSALGQTSTWTLVNGTIGSATISFDLGNAGIHRFSGTFGATRMTGTFVTTQPGSTQTGSFAVSRQ